MSSSPTSTPNRPRTESGSTTTSGGINTKVSIVALVLLAIGLSGFGWVKKENAYHLLARELATQRKTEQQLLTTAAHLKAQYILYSETTVIEQFARTKLDMYFPVELPDTVLINPKLLHPSNGVVNYKPDRDGTK